MIKHLDIKNYGLIETMQIDFADQLNIITGETGAGKSMLLGAMGLILGNRLDAKMMRQSGKRCVVEAIFLVKSEAVKSAIDAFDMEVQEEVVIRREITASGKSRIFINDGLATLRDVQRLCSHLVDLHQQFENLGINRADVQMQILDAMAGSQADFTTYQSTFKKWSATKAQLEKAMESQRQLLKEKDYLEFQLGEFDQMGIDPASDAVLEDQVTQAGQSEDLRNAVDEGQYILDGHESSLVAQLNGLKNRLSPFVNIKAVVEYLERLEAVIIELEDMANAMTDSTQMEIDPQELEEKKSRLDQLNRLMHKHNVPDIHQLVETQEKLQTQLDGILEIDDTIAKIEAELSQLDTQLLTHANKLTKKRHRIVPKFEKSVNTLLGELRMEGAQFKVELSQTEFSPLGKEHIQFLFAGNSGSHFNALKDTASGGELSRISLVIKSLIAEKVDLPTLIFDEIDSGVSGDVAKRMGEIFKDMSAKHQIISITHSPQVAACADAHFRVFKTSEQGSARSQIALLGTEESIEEIATMLSSSPPSKKAIASARELIQSS